MAGDVKSDVDRLLGCFQRGVSQRSQNQRNGDGKEQTPRKYATIRHSIESTHCPEVASTEESIRTPKGKEHQIGSHLGRPDSRNVVALRKSNSACKQISPGVFYGSPLGKPATKPPQLLRLLSDIRRDLAGQNHSRYTLTDEETLELVLTYRDGLLIARSCSSVESAGEFTQATATRAAIWATFPRQEQAVQFAESDSKQKLVVFQYQDHINGQRRFLATTYDEFWHRYSGMIADYRHHYELIQEGKPCHLYFDLEFNRRVNTGADGEAMVDLLLTVVKKTFLDIYGLKYDPSWTVELDSSTADKFSRHLIIHAQHTAFKSNLHVGAFVGEICKRIHHLKERNEDMNRLFVLQGESRSSHRTEIFVDQGVYSRNRSFRLPFSSKAGKTARLLPTKRFRCQTLEGIQIFMDSLICRVNDECERLLTFGQEEPGRGGTLDFASWKEKPATYPQKGPAFCLSGKSPFPALDTFVESVACIGNVLGRIRSWYWFSEYGVVVYNISENRFCENIGRPHKSNNVMYIVDFRTAGYYQKCHDPDCRATKVGNRATTTSVEVYSIPSLPFHTLNQRYRSDLRPIPRHTIPPEYPLSSAPPPCSLSQQGERNRFFGEEWEDETWWEEVVSSMSGLECASQSQKGSQVSSLGEDTKEDDEDWWRAVEREVVKLENSLISRPSNSSQGLSSSQYAPSFSVK